MSPAFEQLASREFQAWQGAQAAVLALSQAHCEASRLHAAATAKFRADAEAFAEAMSPAVAVIPIDRFRVALEAAARERETSASEAAGYAPRRAEFEDAVTAWDVALQALVEARAPSVEEVAHQISRLAASEQEAKPAHFYPQGFHPCGEGSFRASLRAPGGFEQVLFNLAGRLCDLSRLHRLPGAA